MYTNKSERGQALVLAAVIVALLAAIIVAINWQAIAGLLGLVSATCSDVNIFGAIGQCN